METSPGTDPGTDEVPPSRNGADLGLRRLLLQLTGVLVLLAVVGVGVHALVREEAEAWGSTFVEEWGVLGVMLAFLVPDATTLPIPPEFFMGLAIAGGMPFWKIVIAGSTGSVVGACIAFGVSRAIARVAWVRHRLEARGAELGLLLQQYGVIGLVLGALTPLPFSLMAYTAGLLGMRFRIFFLVTLLRIPRVALYLLPMWIGWSST